MFFLFSNVYLFQDYTIFELEKHFIAALIKTLSADKLLKQHDRRNFKEDFRRQVQ